MIGRDKVPGHRSIISRIALSRNLLASVGSFPLENIIQTWPKWSCWSMAVATTSSSFEPRQTAAFIVISAPGIAFAIFSSSLLPAASTCIPSASAAARKTDKNWPRSASDGSGTSKAATVLALSGWAAPHPVTTTQIARVTIHRIRRGKGYRLRINENWTSTSIVGTIKKLRMTDMRVNPIRLSARRTVKLAAGETARIKRLRPMQT